MIVLHSSMQAKIILSMLVANVMCLHFHMQEEDTLKHTNAKCHSCTF